MTLTQRLAITSASSTGVGSMDLRGQPVCGVPTNERITLTVRQVDDGGWYGCGSSDCPTSRRSSESLALLYAAYSSTEHSYVCEVQASIARDQTGTVYLYRTGDLIKATDDFDPRLAITSGGGGGGGRGNQAPAIIPHIAQGQGWSTRLYIVNGCDESATFRIDLVGHDGAPKSFVVDGSDLRHDAITSGADPMRSRESRLVSFSETGNELIQGYGHLIDNGDGCVVVDTEYRQMLTSGEILFCHRPAPANVR